MVLKQIEPPANSLLLEKSRKEVKSIALKDCKISDRDVEDKRVQPVKLKLPEEDNDSIFTQLLSNYKNIKYS